MKLRSRSLAKMPGLERLLSFLGDPNPPVRCTAAQSLQQIGDPAQLPYFLTLVEDEHFEVRLAAIKGLRRFSDPAVMPAIVAHLVDKDSDVRRAAAQALGSIGDAAALEPLVLLLADEEPAVRHAATAALEEINPRWVRTEALQRAIPRLEARRKDPQPRIAAAVDKALQKISAAKDSDTQMWNQKSGIRNL